MPWYMAVMGGEAENEYGQYRDDQDAIDGLLAWNEWVCEDAAVLEIYRCDDDECLTPVERIWS